MITSEDMIWDARSRRYYLSRNYVLNELALDIDTMADDEFDPNESRVVERTIKEACDQVYDFMQMNALHYPSTMYCVSHNEFFNDELKRALGLQVDFYTLHGDIANKEGSKYSDRISNATVGILIGSGLLNKMYATLPAIEEW